MNFYWKRLYTKSVAAQLYSSYPKKGESYIKIILEEYGSKEVKLKYLYQTKTKLQGEYEITKTPRIYYF